MGNVSSGGFAYEIADRSESFSRLQHYWQLHAGRRKADKAEVSIFRLDKVSSSRSAVEAGQLGLRNLKTIRHPCILQFLEGADLEKELIIVTEPVMPLEEWLDSLAGDRRDEQVAWGLRCVLSALEFLGKNQGLSHGAIGLNTIFITRGGDWKLGCLDLLCEWKPYGRDSQHFVSHEGLIKTRAPERRGGDTLTGPPAAIDVWALGMLIGEVLQPRKLASSALLSLQRRMVVDNPDSRPNPGQLLQHSYFTSRELVQVLSFLEVFSLKDEVEKAGVFQRMAEMQRAGRLPLDVGVYKVMPVFKNYVQLEGSGSNATPSQRQLLLTALPVILDIMRNMTGDSFKESAEPMLLQLFELNDRGIRAVLLQQLEHLAAQLSDASVNGKIFESVLAGFSDSVPQLRELTLKSMLCLTDRLNEKNLNDRLLRSLAKLQTDPEPSIRTNTIIFLGRTASLLKEGIRARVLLPALLKGCRDPFPHARMATLRATSACVSYFDPVSIAVKLLPLVDPLLVDPDGSVRDAAFACHDGCIKVLVAHSKVLKEDEEKQNAARQGGVAKVNEGQATGTAFSGNSGIGTSVSSSTKRAAAGVDDAPGYGWEDDELFFDAAPGGVSKDSVPSGRSEGGSVPQNEGWDFEDEDPDEPSRGQVSSSSSMGKQGLSSSSVGVQSRLGARSGSSGDGLGMSSSSSSSRLKALASAHDDLFSMLNDGPSNKEYHRSTVAAADGLSTAKGPETQLSTGGLTGPGQDQRASTAPGAKERKPRLAAKKLAVSSSEWDNW